MSCGARCLWVQGPVPAAAGRGVWSSELSLPESGFLPWGGGNMDMCVAGFAVRILWQFNDWKAFMFVPSRDAHFTDEKEGGLRGLLTP